MKELIEKLLDCKGKIQDIQEEMDSIEEALMDKELIYKGNYARFMMISSNFQNVTLYVEDEEGRNWEEYLPVEEVLDILG